MAAALVEDSSEPDYEMVNRFPKQFAGVQGAADSDLERNAPFQLGQLLAAGRSS